VAAGLPRHAEQRGKRNDLARLARRARRLPLPCDAPPAGPRTRRSAGARELRVPGGAAAQHANGAIGIASVAIGAVDVGDIEWRYASLRERGAPQVELRKADKDGIVDVRFRSG